MPALWGPHPPTSLPCLAECKERPRPLVCVSLRVAGGRR